MNIWVYKSIPQIKNEIQIKRYKQERIIKRLKAKKILKSETRFAKYAKVKHFQINIAELIEMLEDEKIWINPKANLMRKRWGSAGNQQ